MSYFQNRTNNPTVTIKLSDIDTEEKAETFIELFGRSKYNEVFHAFSEQRHGDGTMQSIHSEMETLDPLDDQEVKRYEKLKEELKKASEALKERSQISVQVPIGQSTRENVFRLRRLAKDYLGPVRYEKASGLENMAFGDDKLLRKKNRHIDKVEQKSADITAQLEALDQKRQDLIDQKRHKSDEE